MRCGRWKKSKSVRGKAVIMTLLASRVNITEEKYASNCYTIYINDNIKVNTNREYKSKLFDKFSDGCGKTSAEAALIFFFLSFAQMKIYFLLFPRLCFAVVSTMKNRTKLFYSIEHDEYGVLC